jgi:hypothetical protein
MGLLSVRKWSPLILTVYLAFMLMGIFTFAAVEPLRSVNLSEDETTSGVSVIQQNLSADTPIESEPAIGKARSYSFSPLRNGSPRTIMPMGSRDTGSVPAQVSLKAIEKINTFTIKNTIHLKLRI